MNGSLDKSLVLVRVLYTILPGKSKRASQISPGIRHSLVMLCSLTSVLISGLPSFRMQTIHHDVPDRECTDSSLENPHS